MDSYGIQYTQICQNRMWKFVRVLYDIIAQSMSY